MRSRRKLRQKSKKTQPRSLKNPQPERQRLEPLRPSDCQPQKMKFRPHNRSRKLKFPTIRRCNINLLNILRKTTLSHKTVNRPQCQGIIMRILKFRSSTKTRTIKHLTIKFSISRGNIITAKISKALTSTVHISLCSARIRPNTPILPKPVIQQPEVAIIGPT